MRAKKTIADAGVPFEVPTGSDRAARLASVLEVIYLIFNEGYSATAGDDWMRPTCAPRRSGSARLLAALAPDEPEVHGLLALMELQSSRLAARVGPDGEPVLLLDQDRRRWDRLLIRRGLAALDRAEELGGAPGPYVLQAAIAACHAAGRRVPRTPTGRAIVGAVRAARVGDPVAGRRAEPRRRGVDGVGPAAGARARRPARRGDGALDGYHLLHSVRGDLLEKLGRRAEAGRRSPGPRSSRQTPRNANSSTPAPAASRRPD